MHYANITVDGGTLCVPWDQPTVQLQLATTRRLADLSCLRCLEILAQLATVHERPVDLQRITQRWQQLTWEGMTDAQRRAYLDRQKAAKQVRAKAKAEAAAAQAEAAAAQAKKEARAARQATARARRQARREKAEAREKKKLLALEQAWEKVRQRQLVRDAAWETTHRALAERVERVVVRQASEPEPQLRRSRDDPEAQQIIRLVQAQLDAAQTPEEFARILRWAPTRFSSPYSPRPKRVARIVLHDWHGQTLTFPRPERLVVRPPPVHLPEALQPSERPVKGPVDCLPSHSLCLETRRRCPSLSQYDSRGWLGLHAWKMTT